MKILLIHQYFLENDDAGGSRWNEISKIWSDMGHEITVIAGMMHANGNEKRNEYKGKYFVKKSNGNVKVHRTHVSESYNSGFSGRLLGYFSFMFSSLWAGLFHVKGKFDVVIVTSPPLFVGFSGFLISLFRNTPMVFEIRDLWPESAIDTGILENKWIIKFSYWFENFIYKKSRLINVLTPAFYIILKEKKNVPEEKLVMVQNSENFKISDAILDEFNPILFREESGIKDKFVITYVGAHGVANHLIQLIDAAEQLKDTNVLFQLIGSGMQKKSLIEEVKNRKLNNVVFIDAVPKSEVFKYIIASDLGTSVLKKVETFKTIYSNKTFDYMACKKPILLLIY